MKSTKIILAAIAITAMVVSCNKPAEGPGVVNSNTKKSVSIVIANQVNDNGLSRATGAFNDAESLTIPVATTDELWAVFANEDGDLVGTPTQLSAAENQNEETATTEQYTYTFHELPAEVTKIAITDIDPTGDNPLAEVEENAENPGFQTLAEIIAYGQSVEGFDAQKGDLSDIFVYGETTSTFTASGLVENHGGVDIIHYNGGDVTVQPLLARIEIGNILCTNLALGEEDLEEGEDIPQFGSLTLKTIGIQNVYNAVSSSATGRTLIEYSADDAGLALWNADCGYATETEAATDPTWNIDLFTGTLSDNETPYEAQAFVHNITPGNVPNIILEIGEATWNEALGDIADEVDLEGPFFVKSTGLEGITTISAGTIYQVNFEFACENVKGWISNSELKCVSINVIVPKWEIVRELKPSFGDNE